MVSTLLRLCYLCKEESFDGTFNMGCWREGGGSGMESIPGPNGPKISMVLRGLRQRKDQVKAGL